MSSCLAIALVTGQPAPARAADPAAAHEVTPAVAAKKHVAPASAGKSVTEQLNEAVESGALIKKRITLVVNGKEKKFITIPAKEPSAPADAPAKPAASEHPAESAHAAASKRAPAAVNPQASRQYIRAKAAALTGHEAPEAAPLTGAAHHEGEVHWAYTGDNGPQAWGKLKPDFNVCALGKRQSPINIEETGTLQGPAEPLRFNYQPSSGSVVNNGHTIQVDLYGDNSLTVRDSTYKLVQFHFHHPSEEQVNYRGFAMVAHLVHKNAEGQLAVVAVLLDPGVANALVNKVWTYMPLDAGDRVRMPTGLIDMNELLPKDQRYYQFMGSLTTPPCTEGVLWLVLKQPTPVSREQIKLFSQLFPLNARPVQAVNGRPIRDAQ
ncbi:carbonic anhydrase [Rhodoferax ferrireducens]|uniref:carbonic anhydrase n=1 Tax=Rhodoferax ferrireducens TaxID=192843 RepID=UPI001300B681|nr:carbonic anhydrase family protein [Rhodoferax ferrireducens]